MLRFWINFSKSLNLSFVRYSLYVGRYSCSSTGDSYLISGVLIAVVRDYGTHVPYLSYAAAKVRLDPKWLAHLWRNRWEQHVYMYLLGGSVALVYKEITENKLHWFDSDVLLLSAEGLYMYHLVWDLVPYGLAPSSTLSRQRAVSPLIQQYRPFNYCRSI